MKVRRFILPNSILTQKDKIKRFCSYLYVFSHLEYVLVALHNLFCPPRNKKKFIYEVSICLIFKDEAPYLREWLEYHILIGVEHFYLYNNNSSDEYLEILTPYIKKNIVTLIDWKRNYSQVGAYEHCYKNFSEETNWLGFIDADEFINLSVDTGNSINTFLNHYKKYPSVYIFWRIFGTSGILKENQSKLVTEQYTSCWPNLCNVGKSFINTNYRFKNICIHWCKTEFLGFPIFGIIDNKRFSPYMEYFPKRDYMPKAYINHYWSKSREKATYKTFVKTDAADKSLEEVRRVNGIDFFELQCSEKDFSIQRWLVKLKEQMHNEF